MLDLSLNQIPTLFIKPLQGAQIDFSAEHIQMSIYEFSVMNYYFPIYFSDWF